MTQQKRRGAGMGTIRERVDGRWEGRYFDPDKGKLVGVYAPTRREAEAKLAIRLGKVRAGLPIPSERLTVDAYLTRWVTEGAARWRPSTAKRYRELVVQHIVPTLGKIKLARLQVADVDRMMTTVQVAGLGPRTAAHCRAVLRVALADAERNGLVARNVAKLAKAPKMPAPHPAVLSPADVKTMLDALDPGLRRLVLVAITSGLRVGEQLGLRWEDIDWDRRCLTVRSTLSRMNGAYVLGEPKSVTSRRVVSLTADALEALRDEQQAQRQARLAAGRRWREVIPGLVFTTDRGAPRNNSALTHRLQTALAGAALPPLRWHDLRGAHGSLLLAEGTDISVVSRRLGHSSVALTSRFYGGVASSLDRASADRLERDLSRPS
jgi:integrase